MTSKSTARAHKKFARAQLTARQMDQEAHTRTAHLLLNVNSRHERHTKSSNTKFAQFYSYIHSDHTHKRGIMPPASPRPPNMLWVDPLTTTPLCVTPRAARSLFWAPCTRPAPRHASSRSVTVLGRKCAPRAYIRGFRHASSRFVTPPLALPARPAPPPSPSCAPQPVTPPPPPRTPSQPSTPPLPPDCICFFSPHAGAAARPLSPKAQAAGRSPFPHTVIGSFSTGLNLPVSASARRKAATGSRSAWRHFSGPFQLRGPSLASQNIRIYAHADTAAEQTCVCAKAA